MVAGRVAVRGEKIFKKLLLLLYWKAYIKHQLKPPISRARARSEQWAGSPPPTSSCWLGPRRPRAPEQRTPAVRPPTVREVRWERLWCVDVDWCNDMNICKNILELATINSYLVLLDRRREVHGGVHVRGPVRGRAQLWGGGRDHRPQQGRGRLVEGRTQWEIRRLPQQLRGAFQM